MVWQLRVTSFWYQFTVRSLIVTLHVCVCQRSVIRDHQQKIAGKCQGLSSPDRFVIDVLLLVYNKNVEESCYSISSSTHQLWAPSVNISSNIQSYLIMTRWITLHCLTMVFVFSYMENHPWFAAMVWAMIEIACYSGATLVHCHYSAISQCKKIIILSHICQSLITAQETPILIWMKTGSSELGICRKCGHNNKQR